MPFSRLFLRFASLALLPASAWALSAWALDGREIMMKHEEARKVPSFMAKAVLTSAKSDGSAKEKSFTIWRKLKVDAVHFNSLTRFRTPAEVKNEAILFLENEKGENDILIYLPAYQKVRRIERAQQSASFMGSDFSYSDITSPHVDDYVDTLKGEEPCPPVKEATCFKVEMKPATDSIRERTGYSRILTWVRKDNFMVVQNENYDAMDALAKTAVLSEIERLPSGKWFTKKIAVTTKKDGGTTALHFSEVKTEAKIDESIFTQQSLAKGGKE
jgi:outer membrane lipoprotein-sorting protein